MRAVHWMAYFDLSKLNFAKLISWKRSNSNCNGNRRDKAVLKTTCNKNVKFKIVKIRTSCQYVGYFYYSKNLNWAAQNVRLGRGLDIAVVDEVHDQFCGFRNDSSARGIFHETAFSRFWWAVRESYPQRSELAFRILLSLQQYISAWVVFQL